MDITSIIALLGAMSLSVERVVEMVKSMVPFLAAQQTDVTKERYRRGMLHLLSAFVGAVIAYVARGQIQSLFPTIFKTPGEISMAGYLIIGLLTSGGSGFWNQSLGIVEEIRKAKKLQVKQLKAKVR